MFTLCPLNYALNSLTAGGAELVSGEHVEAERVADPVEDVFERLGLRFRLGDFLPDEELAVRRGLRLALGYGSGAFYLLAHVLLERFVNIFDVAGLEPRRLDHRRAVRFLADSGAVGLAAREIL